MTARKLLAVPSLCALSMAAAQSAIAEDSVRLAFDATASSQASVTYGPYVRGELGSLMPELSGGYWLPPGANDPRINFDLDGSNTGLASIAVGFDWQNGVRADVAFLHSGDMGFSGPCSSASDGSDCDLGPPRPTPAACRHF